ncbi:MAG: ABC transporter substrate-binding protein [Betaproteobacteria bacterium]|jgi:trehalose/maltose transport system substrate-binding protein|nr:ABC transporter substrate-binding protein [Betaproteobacteria bacterium]
MRRGWRIALVALALAPGVVAQAATISISCSAVGRELEICREGAEAWAKETGHTVRLVSTPNSASERLALYQQLLAARAPDLDVLQIDIVWPGILAGHLVDLSANAAALRSAFFPELIRNDTVGGRLVALPWFVNVGLLYYRSDLLERHGRPIPRTWKELTDTATRIQRAERAAGTTRLWGFVWQGRAYEGLTCDALEWLASHGGGTIVGADGHISVDNPRAAAAISLAASWVRRISPEGVLNYAEEESRGVFQSGLAVFMRNWPYAWSLLQSPGSPVRGKVGIAMLPAAADGRPAATLGGAQLAVSRYSRNREAAASLVLYLVSRAEQKRRALVGGYHPTIPALYDDPELLRTSPLFGTLRDALDGAVARPSSAVGADYNRVSYAFANAVHTVLAGQSDAESSLRALERRLRRLKRRGNWPAVHAAGASR